MLRLTNVEHQYNGETVLSVREFNVGKGEHWLIHGLSGSGKTTLLHVVSGLLRPTTGHVVLAGTDLGKLSEAELDRFRGQHVGIVFQRFHLLDPLTVRNNLLLASYLAGKEQDRERVEEVLDSLDLLEKADAYPAELSFGQRQRVAIARAVVNRPDLLVADEPTSNLDDDRCEKVIDLLTEQARLNRATLIVATHDKRIGNHFTNRLNLSPSHETVSGGAR